MSWKRGLLIGMLLAGGLSAASGLQAGEGRSSPAAPPGGTAKTGKLTGIVTEKTDKYVMVQAEGASEAKRYLFAPEGGGAPKADLQAALKTVFVPNLVALEWQGQEQPVLTAVRVILPRMRTGVVTGIVVVRASKAREVWLEVKPSGKGFTERYWPRFVGGPDGFDKGMIRTIGELNPGDKIKLAWAYDERKRAAAIQILARSKQARAKPEEKSAPAR
ncbi:MAG: hypothetical protein ABSG86_02180 [Thermoguttaceae bacterium]|jgi:hypothetical protein